MSQGGRPWVGANGWGCEARVPSLPPQLSPQGPLLPFAWGSPFPENRRLESRACFPPLPSHRPCPAGREWFGPFGPCHLRPLFGCTGLLSMEAGPSVGKATSWQPEPGPGEPGGRWHPCPGVGRTVGEGQGPLCGIRHKRCPRVFLRPGVPLGSEALPGLGELFTVDAEVGGVQRISLTLIPQFLEEETRGRVTSPKPHSPAFPLSVPPHVAAVIQFRRLLLKCLESKTPGRSEACGFGVSRNQAWFQG